MAKWCVGLTAQWSESMVTPHGWLLEVYTDFRSSMELAFRSPSCIQHPLHTIPNSSKKTSVTHSPGFCWPWKNNAKFERLQTMYDLTLLVVLPLYWAFPKQCQNERLSFLLSSGSWQKPALKFACKESSMYGLQTAADSSVTYQGLQAVGHYQWRHWF